MNSSNLKERIEKDPDDIDYYDDEQIVFKPLKIQRLTPEEEEEQKQIMARKSSEMADGPSDTTVGSKRTFSQKHQQR